MATVESHLAAAKAELDGTDAGIIRSLPHLRSAANQAVLERDFANAIIAGEAILSAISSLPNSEKEGMSTKTKLEWRDSTNEFLKRMSMQQIANASMAGQIVEVTYSKEDPLEWQF